jgi:two-component system, NarL family, nitrate/nitrite response regulator NarL
MSNEMNLIRIVIADEHPTFRQDLRQSLESEAGLRILGEASDADTVRHLAQKNKPDILLVDFALARKCELTMLSSSARHLRIVVTITTMEKAQLVEAFRLGAHGVVLKRSTPQVLHKSIRSVMAGQYWLERDSVGVLVEALRDSLAQGNGTKSPKDYGLTRREVDIITKIASGRSNKEVGEEFAISERTVKHHLTNIFGKVGVTSRLQLALFAVNQHLMGSRDPSLTLQSVQGDGDI